MRAENHFVASTSIQGDELNASTGTMPMPSSQLSPSERLRFVDAVAGATTGLELQPIGTFVDE